MLKFKEILKSMLFSVAGLLLMPFFLLHATEEQDSMEYLLYADIPEVVTASRQVQKITDAPATIFVITEQDIRERGYKDLKDIFRDLPGFDISENVEGEARTLVIARGIIGENKIMFLLDNKKMNSTCGERFVLGNNIPLSNVKRIELIYGPSSAMYGADAYAGVVNIITKTAKDFTEAKKSAEVDVSYGTQNTKDGSFLFAKEFSENISSMVSFRYYNSDGLDPTKNYDEYRNLSWDQPIKDYQLYTTLSVKDLTLGIYLQNAKEPCGPSTNITWYTFDNSYFWQQKQNKIFLEYLFQSDNITLTSTMSYDEYEIDPESNFNYAWIGTWHQYKYGRNASAYLEEQLNYKINETNSLVSGLKVERVDAFAKGNNLSSPFSSDYLIDSVTYPNDPAIPAQFRNQTLQVGVTPYTDYSVFAEWQSLMEKIRFNFGVRYDYNKTEGSVGPDGYEGTGYGGVFTPRAGLIFNPIEKLNIKLLYGQAYIKPSKYSALEHWSAGLLGYYPNSNLKPEELRSYAVNLEYIYSPNFKIALNSYYNQIKNLITPLGSLWNTNINRGEPETKGCELLADWVFQYLKAYAYYSYLDAKQDSGIQMNKVAKNKAQAGITYMWSKLSLSPRVRWSDEIYYLSGNGVATMKGHTVFDFTARLNNIWKGFSAYLTINNVLNTDYYTASPFGEAAEGWLMSQAAQPERNGEIGIQVSF